MTAAQLVPVAQYLRMSTEHQQYSLENQITAIQKYAVLHDFEIVRTYSDAGRSGVILKHRVGLRQLLQDVVNSSADFRAILVYDVSRWGRFQDSDESAHYEFLCKSAGVPVHYCAEQFANDGSMPSLIMKALKRTMAGEYSRELGVKVLAGLRRLAELGFKQGGRAGYGLRRMLLSADGRLKQRLESGEYKSLATDRVVLVPGPPDEVQVVKNIYRMFVSDQMGIRAIVEELNRKGIRYRGISVFEWRYQSVWNILRHPKYCGRLVFGRTSCKLHTPVVRLPRSEWIVKEGALEPIILPETFEKAQKILRSCTWHLTDSELLDRLRTLLRKSGRLTLSIIKKSRSTPSPSTYTKRFGSLCRAYELIGYGQPLQFGRDDMARKMKAFHREVVTKIAEKFPNEIQIVGPNEKYRKQLRLSDGVCLPVLVVRAMKREQNGSICWEIDPRRHALDSTILLVRLNRTNSTYMDYYVLPGLGRDRKFQISLNDPWLDRGIRVDDLSKMLQAIEQVRRTQSLKLAQHFKGYRNKRHRRE